MDSYFERLEEIIKRHEQEIDHLNNERNALRQEENNMPIDEFNREYQNIINYLENETRSLNEAQTTLETYHYNYDKASDLIKDLRVLRDDLKSARDKQDEDDINEEISSKEQELTAAIQTLPLELADYLRNSFLNETTVDYNDVDSLPTNDTDDVERPLATEDIANLPTEITPNVQTDIPIEEPIDQNLLPEAQKDYDLLQADIEKLRQAEEENEKIFQ